MSDSVVVSFGSLGTLVSDVEGSPLDGGGEGSTSPGMLESVDDDVEGSHGPHEQAQYSGPHMPQ